MTNDQDPEKIEPTAADAEVAARLRASLEDSVPAESRPGPERSFWVRKRTFFSLVFPLVLLVVAKPTMLWFVFGVGCVVIGQLTRLWAAGTLTKNEELATYGIYSRVRNPLYLGSLLLAVGYCLMSGRWWSFVALGIFYPMFYLTTILSEEKYLRQRYEQEFEEYCHNVPRLRPRITAWIGLGQEGRFSLEHAQLNSEHVSFLVSGFLTLAFALRPLLPMWW